MKALESDELHKVIHKSEFMDHFSHKWPRCEGRIGKASSHSWNTPDIVNQDAMTSVRQSALKACRRSYTWLRCRIITTEVNMLFIALDFHLPLQASIFLWAEACSYWLRGLRWIDARALCWCGMEYLAFNLKFLACTHAISVKFASCIGFSWRLPEYSRY